MGDIWICSFHILVDFIILNLQIPVKQVDFGYLRTQDIKSMKTSAGILIEPPITVEYITIVRGEEDELLE